MGLWQKLVDKQKAYNEQQREIRKAGQEAAASAADPSLSFAENVKRGMIAAEHAEQKARGFNPGPAVERKVINLIIQDRRDQKKYEAMLMQGWRLEFEPIKRAGLRGATYTFIREITPN